MRRPRPRAMAPCLFAVGLVRQPSSYFDQQPWQTTVRHGPPGAASGGLELGEVRLPDLVGSRRLHREGRLPPGGELAAFTLVIGLQDQPLIAQEPQNGGLGHHVPVVAAPVIGIAQTLL